MWADSHLTWTGRGSAENASYVKDLGSVISFRGSLRQSLWCRVGVDNSGETCPSPRCCWPRASASTRLCKLLSYHPPITTRGDHTLINNTSSKPSLFWLLKSFWHVGNCECDTIIIIDNSLSSIYINDGFIITLLCIIIILHLHPASNCLCLCCLSVSHCHCPLNVSMSQCVLTIHWLLPIAAW